ncbi:MAG: hypothetical protein RL417_1359 [Pseudomonadota bacterium]|jgi:kojibiose phosphorylase
MIDRELFVVSADGWTIGERAFDVRQNRKFEGLFTQGSGYLHLRGCLEEHLSDAPQNRSFNRAATNVTAEKFAAVKAKWGTFVPGLYGRHPHLNNELVNLPHFVGFGVSIAGEHFDLERSTYSSYTRALNLKSATLTRSCEWQVGGARVKLCWERFISAVVPQLAVQRLTVTSDKAVTVEIASMIDSDVRTNGFDHFKAVSGRAENDGTLVCSVKTDRGDTATLTSRHRGLILTPDGGGERLFAVRGALTLESGKTWTFEKRTLVGSSRDRGTIGGGTSGVFECSYEELLAAHSTEWASRWERAGVSIEGDPDAQLAVRVAQYHLLRAAPRHDDRVSVDAKGYAGEAYFGRFFWDSEIFLLPTYLYTEEPVARALVNYRVNALPGARRNAERLGYDGARYGWESDAEGDESCALWQYRDHEVHITAGVVYALAHDAATLNDPAYWRGGAGEVLAETARYWFDRIDYDDTGAPNLLGVMGPDEYAPLTSNNAYTNRLVSFALALAARHGSVIGLTSAEVEKAQSVGERLPVPRRADGLVLQADGFDKLAEPRFQDLWKDRSRPYAAQVNQERLYRSQNLKQADVLMLMYLFPHEFSDVEVRQAWDYYEPRTTHDSSLSCAIHSIIATRLKMPEVAWRYWLKGAFIDLDFTHDGPAEGIHIAAAAGNWLVTLNGFLGFRFALQSPHLKLEPALPERWSLVEVPLSWRGHRVGVRASTSRVEVRNISGNSLEVEVWGAKRTVPPHGTEVWSK